MKTTTAPPDRLPICCVWLLRSTGIDRIRFTTSHPIEFTDDIIEVYRDTPELVSFLHLPVQSGSDRILNLMGRTHTALEYKAMIRKLRAARPDIQISSRASSSASLAKPPKLRENDEADCRRQFRHELQLYLSLHVRVHQPPIWLMMFRKKRRSSVCIFCKNV